MSCFFVFFSLFPVCILRMCVCLRCAALHFIYFYWVFPFHKWLQSHYYHNNVIAYFSSGSIWFLFHHFSFSLSPYFTWFLSLLLLSMLAVLVMPTFKRPRKNDSIPFLLLLPLLLPLPLLCSQTEIYVYGNSLRHSGFCVESSHLFHSFSMYVFVCISDLFSFCLSSIYLLARKSVFVCLLYQILLLCAFWFTYTQHTHIYYSLYEDLSVSLSPPLHVGTMHTWVCSIRSNYPMLDSV